MRKASVLTILFVAVALLGSAAPPAQATNDPRWGDQWGPVQMLAERAWTKTKGQGVIVAVVDSGVDLQHPDLEDKLVDGYDYGDGDDNPDDDSPLKDGAGKLIKGHGTHVAGTIGAETDNGEGVAAVAPAAKIMPMKIFASKAGGTLATGIANVPRAISDSVSRGAKVINLSIGGLQGTSLIGTIETPCLNAYNAGALCVVAAGNSGKGKPSGYDHGVSFLNVTANDVNRNRAGFGQNADTQWALSAPGVDIMSTYPVESGAYVKNQGTSMAAPHAAGAAALLFAQGLNNKQVVEKLLNTATPSNDAGMGRGIVNAGAATGAEAPPAGSAAAKGSATTVKKPAAGAAGSGGGRAGSSGGSGLEGPTGGQPGGPGLPGEASDDGSFDDQFNQAGEQGGEAEQASSTKDKASGMDSTTMLGILAAFLLLGVVIPVAQQWGRRGSRA